MRIKIIAKIAESTVNDRSYYLCADGLIWSSSIRIKYAACIGTPDEFIAQCENRIRCIFVPGYQKLLANWHSSV